jgi:hypothetical protein
MITWVEGSSGEDENGNKDDLEWVLNLTEEQVAYETYHSFTCTAQASMTNTGIRAVLSETRGFN